VFGRQDGGSGKVALFLFGTLMDLDVMRTVLDRAFDPRELEPAELWGYRRVRPLNAPYPILVPDRAGRVPGLLLARPSARDLVRLRHFESEEYETSPVIAHTADGRRVAAEAFMSLEGVFEHAGEPWELEDWVSRCKGPFLRRCGAWMLDCPEPAAAPG
jgi:hypothetical protein